MAGHHPRPFLLFLLPALDKVWDPGRETEVVRIISGLFLLLLLVLALAAAVAPDGAIDPVVPGW